MDGNLTVADARENILTGLKLVRDGYHRLIAEELEERRSYMELQEEKAVAVLSECIDAMTRPQEEIKTLRAELVKARSEVMQWTAAMSEGDVASRVEARIMSQGWAEESARLQEKLKLADADITPLVKAVDSARYELRKIQNAKVGIAFCMIDPFNMDFAKATNAYQEFKTDVGMLADGIARSIEMPEGGKPLMLPG
jgi:aminopeptidase N